jgi:hypothetical protein
MNPFICNHSRLMVVLVTNENKERVMKKICASCGLDRSDVAPENVLNRR